MSATMATAVRERPIIMTGESVRAILAGTKTQTRRVVVRRGRDEGGPYKSWPDSGWTAAMIARDYPCPYGAPGDRLWVRETWTQVPALAGCEYQAHAGSYAGVRFRATWDKSTNAIPWRSPIHMPRWAARLTLEVTGVRVERVQDISDPDALAEGCSTTDMQHGDRLASVYRRLWDSLNAARGFGWDANPYVWVIEFRRVEAAP